MPKAGTPYGVSVRRIGRPERKSAWETLVKVVFGLFVGGLVLLLVANYSGVILV